MSDQNLTPDDHAFLELQEEGLSAMVAKELEKPTPLTLHQVTTLLSMVQSQLEWNGGEVTPEIAFELARIEFSEPAIVDQVVSFMRDLDARAKGVKAQATEYAAPLEKKAKQMEAQAERLAARAGAYMALKKSEVLAGTVWTIRSQLGPEALVVTAPDIRGFPAEFLKPPAAPELDNAKVKAALKADPKHPVLSALAKVIRRPFVRIY